MAMHDEQLEPELSAVPASTQTTSEAPFDLSQRLVYEGLGVGGEILEDVEGFGEPFPLLRTARRRGASVTWWGEANDADTPSEPDTWYSEYTLDSDDDLDTSVSSTRCSTNADGSVSLSRRSAGRIGTGYRGAQSPHAPLGRGPRGRSVTRRGADVEGAAGAAMRHRHPTHTPNRRIFGASWT